MIFAPDAFLGDWYGWVTNQAAHALLIGALIFALVAITRLTRLQALWLTLALYALWELHTFAGDVLDGVTDFAFVAAGAVFAKAAWEGERRIMAAAFIAIVLAAAVGVWGRL